MRSDDLTRKVSNTGKDKNASIKLEEGVDYYLNDAGLLVFTAAYHLKRGYCCGNNCRHCPYDHQNVPGKSKS